MLTGNISDSSLSLPKRLWGYFKRGCRTAFMILGSIAAVMLVLAFTRLPFDAHRWLGTVGGLCLGKPEAIVVLGGSGMPSGPELMRCDLAADLANKYPEAALVVLLPQDTALADAMVNELTLKGARADRIKLLLHGRNTREQALDLQRSAPMLMQGSIAIVTAPENMYRSLLTFRKVGFTGACGCPTFDHALFDDLRYAHGRIGGKVFMPDVSNSLDLRYNFWNRLKLEITCIREYVALAYYKWNGWT